MNPVKRVIVEDLVKQTGRHDEPQIFGGAPGDPGLIGPDSMSWEINGDMASVVIGGLGAIVMEILHPSVMAGVQDLSSYQEQPERRGKTTFGYVVTTTFGNTQAATRLINAVKRMHGQVEGTRPDGVPYRALDPELIGWVHTCIPWAVMTAYERYNRPLSDEEKDRYLGEQALIGRMGGAGEIPETVADLREYVEEMRPKLAVNQQTLQFFEFLMTMPFGVPLPRPLSRPAHQFQAEAGMSLMPAWARRMTGFDSPAIERRLVHHPSLAVYARAIRWAFGTPAYKRLAVERASGEGAPQRRISAPRSRSVPLDEQRASGGGAMAGVKPIPDGYPQVTPYLIVDGAEAAIQFYTRAFGAKERMRMGGPDGRIGHAEIDIGNGLVMLADEHPDMDALGPKTIGGTPVTISLYVEDVDAVFQAALDAGATELRAIEDQFYGDRTGAIEDPFGHKWHLATHVEDVPPEEMEQRAAAAMTG